MKICVFHVFFLSAWISNLAGENRDSGLCRGIKGDVQAYVMECEFFDMQL